MRVLKRATRASSNYHNRESECDNNYRHIQAMYCKGMSIEEIIKNMPKMQRFEVIEVIQVIFAKEQMRKEKERQERQRYQYNNSYSYNRYNSRGSRYDYRR